MNAKGQWEPDVRLTNSSGQSTTTTNNASSIATNGNVIHTVWWDNRDGNWEIYYKRSTNGGSNWGADTRLTNDIANSSYPTISVMGSNVYIVWVDFRDITGKIYYKRSSDGGMSWSADTRLSNDSSIAVASSPSMAISGSTIHVVWEDSRQNSEIYYKRSSDGGLTWGEDTRLSNDSSSSVMPSISVSGSIVHVVWYGGSEEVYYKRSSDGGLTWGVDSRLVYNVPYQRAQTSISVSGSVVIAIWADHRNGYPNSEIYYKKSTDGGLNWGGDIRLTNNLAKSVYPSASISGSIVHVIWADSSDGNWEIYYKRSTDGGTTWGTDTRLTNNPAISYLPSFSVSGSVVHVVWYDMRDGNGEIYYKRNPTGNTIGIQNISTEIPSKYSLSQNYPNPFNPITNVKFSIIKAEQVKLIVYDIQGREVQTLVNERLQPGTYEASFDGSMLTSGVYFYKLVTGNFTETKKMLLIK